MSDLYFDTLKINAATLEADNLLPHLFPERTQPNITCQGKIPPEIKEQMKIGHIASILPYSTQSSYSRDTHPVEIRTAVLENEFLRATFLLELGGRLWSLHHKPTGRELLEVNPTIQLANLGIRNAWFSGGVEWNIGTLGHSPFSCDRLFGARLSRGDGTPILRLYEWERFRQVSFQIDAFLPTGSQVLYLLFRISNSNPAGVPMYYWSNIAVPETPETRVITRAKSAYVLGLRANQLVKVPIPIYQKNDLTYPGNYSQAADVFFHMQESRKPWIAVVDREGSGLVHASTEELPGRKMWAWGSGPGGKNWQKFLSPSGKGYFEIQAGITRTQLEHLPLAERAELCWMETYGMIETDPRITHGDDWEEAGNNLQAALDRLIPTRELYAEFEHSKKYLDEKPVDLIQRGAGWGTLEKLRRETDQEVPFCSPGLVFDNAALADEQKPWVQLLREGTMPSPDWDKVPVGFLVSEAWFPKLEKAVLNNKDVSWFLLYHLGLMYYHAGKYQPARTAWERSAKLRPNPWSLRNLAILSWKQDQVEDAANLLLKAHTMAPVLPLTIELGKCLLASRQPRVWLDLLQNIPASIQANGRVRLLQAQAALEEGEIDIVELYFDDLVPVADLREGENSLTDLWFAFRQKQISLEKGRPLVDFPLEEIKARCPPPEIIDFRLTQN